MEDKLIKENKKWANYDYSEFPLVKVYMKNKIESDESFYAFLEEWKSLFEQNNEFTFIFDTTNVGLVNIKYAFKMRNFIKNLKRKENCPLQKSIIITKTRWIRFLLSLIFKMESPVATTYIIDESSKINVFDLLKQIESKKNLSRNVTVYKKD